MESLTLSIADATTVIADRARALADQHARRVVIGIAGGPGVGKSTLAAAVVAQLNAAPPGLAALVPMDGFHMRQDKLEALGLAMAKGAPQTFEPAAFAEFLADLRTTTKAVSGPGYSRAIEDVVDDAFSIAPEVRILAVEGNYLLLPDKPWEAIKPLLDLAVFIDVPRDIARARLLRRHAEHGLFSDERNTAHVDGVDLPNYDLVRWTRNRADLVIDLETSA
jgi:pantothenate kinase